VRPDGGIVHARAENALAWLTEPANGMSGKAVSVDTTTFTEKQPSLRAIYGDEFDTLPLSQVKRKQDAHFAFCTTCEAWLPGSQYWDIRKSMGIHIHDTFEMYTYAYLEEERL
jgi:hypothetical protein